VEVGGEGGPMSIRLNPGHRLWPPTFARRLSGGPQGWFWVTWRSPTSVACSGAPFDLWEAE
jgi:hypothetical protein